MNSNNGGKPSSMVGCGHSMTPKELCQNDDLATALVVDPFLGFQTHKMNIRHRGLGREISCFLKGSIKQFIVDQDYEKVFNRLMSSDVGQRFNRRKPPHQLKSLREHIFRFLQMFDRSSGFTIQPCNRYTQENRLGARLVVTKPWNKSGKFSFDSGQSESELDKSGRKYKLRTSGLRLDRLKRKKAKNKTSDTTFQKLPIENCVGSIPQSTRSKSRLNGLIYSPQRKSSTECRTLPNSRAKKKVQGVRKRRHFLNSSGFDRKNGTLMLAKDTSSKLPWLLRRRQSKSKKDFLVSVTKRFADAVADTSKLKEKYFRKRNQGSPLSRNCLLSSQKNTKDLQGNRNSSGTTYVNDVIKSRS